MGRPRKTPPALENSESTVEDTVVESFQAEPVAPVVRRRRRRKNTGAEANDARHLVDALLHSRAERGATPDELHAIIAWARSVRDEAEILVSLADRPRRQKNQVSVERITRHEMNRALLDGVLGGAIAIDIVDEGLVFRSPDELYRGGTMGEDASETVAEADSSDA